MTTAIYAVEGMTCESCMAEVLENVHSLSGVTDVAMDLVTRGRSPLIVTSGTRLGARTVREAVEKAGFGLLPPRGAEVPRSGDGPSAQKWNRSGSCHRFRTGPVHFTSSRALVHLESKVAAGTVGQAVRQGPEGRPQ